MPENDNRDDDVKVTASANDQFVPITRRDEELATEITVDDQDREEIDRDDDDFDLKSNSVTGWIGLALSIISFFMFPILFGVAGIILGFIARARDAEWLGNTAIAAGIISIVLRLFIRPMFF